MVSPTCLGPQLELLDSCVRTAGGLSLPMALSPGRPAQVSSLGSRKIPVIKRKKPQCLSHLSVTSLDTEKTLKKIQALKPDSAGLKFSFYYLFTE